MTLPLPALVLNLGSYQQETIALRDAVLGTPVDLTGCTLTLGIYRSLEVPVSIYPVTATPEIPLKVSGGDIVLSNQLTAKGQAVVTFNPADYTGISPGDAVVVVWVRDAAGNPRVGIQPSRVMFVAAGAPA